MQNYTGAIFDLDGVLVDTAIFHFMAWQELANDLGIPFTFQDNERLKGISRMESLAILLSLAVPGSKSDRVYEEDERRKLADRKNSIYVEKIHGAADMVLLPGVKDTLYGLRQMHIRTAVGSSSKNAPLIIEKLGAAGAFDAIVDGLQITHSKPDPEVFLLAAKKIAVEPGRCVVIEDASAGIEAAKRAGMYAVGIGLAQNLPGADMVMPQMNPDQVLALFAPVMSIL